MSLVCHSYVTRMYSYVIRMYLYVIRMSLVCTRMYSYVIRMSLVCNLMSSVCHSYLLVCHPYVTRMYLYVIRMSLVYTLCYPYVTRIYPYVIHSYVTRLWFYHEPLEHWLYQANVPSLNSLRKSENLCFSDVFRRYRKGILLWNGLMTTFHSWALIVRFIHMRAQIPVEKICSV